MEAQSVVVIQDASKEVNLKVLEWAMKGLGLQPRDKLTLVAVLHQVTTPMGYKSSLDQKSLNSINKRIIESVLASRKEVYQEKLLKIATNYESKQVEFKMDMITGSSLKDVALKAAIDLKATWLILNKQMKKEEEFFLRKLSCGISRLKRNNMIEHLRGQRERNNCNSMEITPCHSSETSDEGYPPEEEPSPEIPKGETDNDPLIQDVEHIDSSLNDGDGKSPHMNDNNVITGETESEQPSPDKEERSNDIHCKDSNLRLEEDSNQMKAEINGSQASQENDRIQSSSPDEDKNSKTPTINSNQKSETKSSQLNTEKEGLQTNSLHERPDGNQEQIESVPPADFLEKQQEKSILENSENSKCCICSVCKNRRPNIQWQKDFTYQELEDATEGFSGKNSLSECVHGSTFKGQIEDKLKIVIKQHQIIDAQVLTTIKSEIELIIKARHKNVVILLGSLTHESHLLIVYEQACNGSLDKYISSGSCGPLTWKERVKLAVGISRGLKHLHEKNIIHGSIKPSNILLTHDFEPLLGDFDFRKAKLESKEYYKDKKSENTGYAAPEYLEGRKLSVKSDVYSFGVVLLELISGRSATDKISKGKNLVEWAKSKFGGNKYSQLVDPKISSSYKEDQLKWLVQVTGNCLKKNPKDRYSMNMVVSALQDMEDSGKGSEMEDSSPPNSNLICSVPDITVIQDNKEEQEQESSGKRIIQDSKMYTPFGRGQARVDQPREKQEQIESIACEKERSFREMAKENHMTGQTNDHQQSRSDEEMPIGLNREKQNHGEMICNNHVPIKRNADQPSHVEEQIESSFHGEINSLKLRISHNDIIDWEKADQLRQDQKEIQGGYIHKDRSLRLEPIDKSQTKSDQKKMQTSFHGDLSVEYQDEILLEYSNFSLCSICKSRRPNSEGQKKFSYKELQAATDEFSIKNSLSEDGYGPGFRGQLRNKLKIVVKQYQITNPQGEKESKSGIQLLAKIRHENVAMLLGSCIRDSKLLIVNEHACNGSLEQYLSKGSRPLNWGERVKIAIGTCRGLKYLHDNNVIHGSMKPSNILLTHDFRALLADFGFGKVKQQFFQRDENVENSEYTAPESTGNGKPSTKGDIYSLGVILLELISGRRVTEKRPGHKSLVGWARSSLKVRKYTHLVDTKIGSSYDEEQLVSLACVIENCLKKKPKERFSMNVIVSELQYEVDNKEIYVLEDSPPKISDLTGCTTYLTSSLGKGESRAEDLGAKVYQEEWNYITCTISNEDIKISQESKNCITDGGRNKDVINSQENENRITGGGSNKEPKVSQDLPAEPRKRIKEASNSIKQAPLSSEGYCSVGRTPLLQLGHCDHRQKSEVDITSGGSNKERHEEKGLSTKEYQERETCIRYRSARDFFLEGAKEYIVDGRFFTLPNSF